MKTVVPHVVGNVMKLCSNSENEETSNESERNQNYCTCIFYSIPHDMLPNNCFSQKCHENFLSIRISATVVSTTSVSTFILFFFVYFQQCSPFSLQHQHKAIGKVLGTSYCLCVSLSVCYPVCIHNISVPLHLN